MKAPRVFAGMLLLIGILGFVLTSCPSNRDGMAGQLSTAKDETQSAARSAALALQMWSQQRSTRNLTAVQLADARDEMTKAYGDIATLKAQSPTDIGRQMLLTRTMTDLIGVLNEANAAVRAIPDQPDPQSLRQRLIGGADALERNYP